MKILKWGFPLFLIMLLGACNPIQVVADYDKEAHFDTYSSFAFHDKGIEKLPLNDLDKKRVMGNITTQLQARGIQQTSSTESADVIINVLASNEKHIDVNYYNSPYWGWYYYPWNNTPSISRYTEGNLVIDMIDAKTNKLVWTTQGSGFRVDNLKNKEKAIQDAVVKMFSKYPLATKLN